MRHIVLCFQKCKIVLSSKYFDYEYNGDTVTVKKKEDGTVAFKHKVRCHGWNINEEIFVVDEKEELASNSTASPKVKTHANIK